MSKVNIILRLELKRVEDPEFKPVSIRVEDPDPDDQFEMVITCGDGNSVTYLASRGEFKKCFTKNLYRLERH